MDFKAILETLMPRRGRESNMSKSNTKKVYDKFIKILKFFCRVINLTSAFVQVPTLFVENCRILLS